MSRIAGATQNIIMGHLIRPHSTPNQGEGIVRGARAEIKKAGAQPPINKGHPTEPFIFYFSLTIDAYETTT